MFFYVIGGAGSGKSAFAEEQIVRYGAPQPLYIATMEPWGEDARERIDRHRRLRAGKGFRTVECPRDLDGLALPMGCAALLEDLTNLFANLWFGGERDRAADRVLAGLRRLRERAALSVVVGNDLFADGVDYGEETGAYLRALAALSCETAALADRVYEVVCGIPLRLK